MPQTFAPPSRAPVPGIGLINSHGLSYALNINDERPIGPELLRE